MKHIIAIALFFIAATSHADEWTGQDKTEHAVAGASIGFAFTALTKNAYVGCAAATIIGAAKEVSDAKHKETHTASFKDFAVTAVAGCLVSGATSLVITPKAVSYSLSLNLL